VGLKGGTMSAHGGGGKNLRHWLPGKSRLLGMKGGRVARGDFPIKKKNGDTARKRKKTGTIRENH